MQQNRRKLKNYILVNPRFQLRYLLWIVLTGAGILIFYSLLLYLLVKQVYLSVGGEEFARVELQRITIRLALVSMSFVAIIGCIIIVLSHRTAGALYAFQKVFNGIREGNLDLRIQLRKNDDFPEVAQTFNKMMDEIQGKSKN
jgi:signal peptidase II